MSSESSDVQAKAMAHVCQGLHSMLLEKVLCDVQVTVGDKIFHCHLLVLAAVSDFFRCLTSSSWRENEAERVTIKHEDVTQESFQMLLNILYNTGDVVTIDTVIDILRMSIFLQVKFLEQHCVDFLIANLTPEVCVDLWMFAEKYQLPRLADRASMMASDKIDQVVKGSEICQLPKSMLLVVLGSQQKLNMDDTCRTILRWVEEDAENRQVHFEELLPFVSFPQLSPAYIHELMSYFDHPFFKHMHKKIREAISFNLKGQTPELKRQMLARQDRIVQSRLVQKYAVVLGDSKADNTATRVTAFSVEPGTKFYSYALKDIPWQFEPQYATCVCHNELYVCRGSENNTELIKYTPGHNEWETLPHLDFGVEKHSLCAAGNRIYLIGGSSAHKKGAHGISYYDINTKTWTRDASALQVSVDSPATASVGHRIYVFGGTNVECVDTVQCLDTRSGQVHVAGRLPLAAEEMLALSDGGTIYLLCDGTHVLKMKECFELAERKEAAAREKVHNGTAVHATAHPNNSDSSPSVHFLDVGTFPEGNVLSAFLHKGELVGCGTVCTDGTLTSDVRAMNLTTGQAAETRLAFQKPRQRIVIHTLNIPQDYLNEDMAEGVFRTGDIVGIKQTAPLPAFNYHYGYRPQLHEQLGTIQSINADGTVNTLFLGNMSHCSPASHLKFVQNELFSDNRFCFREIRIHRFTI